MINTDALAENHWAHADPAFQSDDDLEEQKEREQERVCAYVEYKLRELLDLLNDDELEIVKDQMNTLADTFAELIEEA